MSRFVTHHIRSGDEPMHARSPLRMRLVLALFGLAISVAAVVFFVAEGATGLAVACGVVGMIAVVDIVVVIRHIRQGAHFQPGRDVPPYHPVEQPLEDFPTRPPLSQRTREHVYLAMMSTCLVLVIVAWTFVRFYSTTAAIVMSAIAAFIPPVASIVANARGDRS
jgi:hypothetical protein